MSYLVVLVVVFSIILATKHQELAWIVPFLSVLLTLLLLELCGVPYVIIRIVYCSIISAYFYLLGRDKCVLP